ncbi:hypothetical protein EBO15_36515 [Actinomadura harenae]|uniref:XRE family transcriptional regulator n=1 Tax=Actinomadura harenae TaxID=2483351 RepID=A0A3M2LK48_9ACTN|nr:hypothetical protein EBO15_36515 [Actinomadura harenae]
MGPRYRLLYAAALDLPEDVLFSHGADAPSLISSDIELMELANRAEASDVGAGTLDLLDVAIERLCCDYPTVAADDLCVRGRAHLDHVLSLLDSRTTLAQHRELLVDAGWLTVLLACVYFDAGDKAAAEIARHTARRLGEQAGHGEIIAWSWEIAAWFALVERRFPDVVACSEAGLRHAGHTNAAVQLTLQAGRGYARMGDGRGADALEIGRGVLNRLPRPDHPENHFVFDHDKYEFYASTIFTMAGQDDAAEEHAREVITQCRPSADVVRWPMRLAMVSLDLGIVAARRGQLDTAVEHARTALSPTRRSGDLLPRTAELAGILRDRFPHESLVGELEEQIRQELVGAGRAPELL